MAPASEHCYSMNTDCANRVLQKFCLIQVYLQHQYRSLSTAAGFLPSDWSWGWICLDIVVVSDAYLILLEWYFCDTMVP